MYRLSIIALAVTTLSLSGCGGSQNESQPNNAAPTAGSTAPAVPPPPPLSTVAAVNAAKTAAKAAKAAKAERTGVEKAEKEASELLNKVKATTDEDTLQDLLGEIINKANTANVAQTSAEAAAQVAAAEAANAAANPASKAKADASAQAAAQDAKHADISAQRIQTYVSEAKETIETQRLAPDLVELPTKIFYRNGDNGTILMDVNESALFNKSFTLANFLYAIYADSKIRISSKGIKRLYLEEVDKESKKVRTVSEILTQTYAINNIETKKLQDPKPIKSSFLHDREPLTCYSTVDGKALIDISNLQNESPEKLVKQIKPSEVRNHMVNKRTGETFIDITDVYDTPFGEVLELYQKDLYVH